MCGGEPGSWSEGRLPSWDQGQVIGVDLNPAMLETARGEAARLFPSA